jgi:hypothetical protein
MMMKTTKVSEILNARKNNNAELVLQLSTANHVDVDERSKAITKAFKNMKNPRGWKIQHVTFSLGHAGLQPATDGLHELLETVVDTFPSVTSFKFTTKSTTANNNNGTQDGSSTDGDNDSIKPGLWPCQLIAKFVHKAKWHLKQLEFQNSGVYGTKADLNDFYSAFKWMLVLRHLKLSDRFTIIDGVDFHRICTVTNMSSLFYSVAKLMSIESIALRCFNRWESDDETDFVATLIDNKDYLTNVELTGIDPAKDMGIASLADALSSRNKIARLKITFAWSRPVDHHDSYYEHEEDEDDEEETGENENEEDLTESSPARLDRTGPHWKNLRRLAEVIGNSTTLRDVEFIFDKFDGQGQGFKWTTRMDYFLFILAERLAVNRKTKLTKLVANPEGCSIVPILTSFQNSLQTNYSLKQLSLIGSDVCAAQDDNNLTTELMSQIQMYLHLNTHGRGKLMDRLGAVSVDEWMELFAKLNDVQCVNYYLSKFRWIPKTALDESLTTTKKRTYNDMKSSQTH